MNPFLRAFRHPAVLASILVLLLNDHLLKAAFPSGFTGKLSDFAGLFFFPFLVAGVAALVLKRVSPARLFLAALALTGLAFSLIKLLPAANRWAAAAVSLLLGAPAGFVMDPSDLMALASFAPAWMLFHRLQGKPAATARPGRLAYAGIILGSLAAMATAACPPIPSISRLSSQDGSLYAGFHSYSGGALAAYRSADAGRTWTLLPATAEVPGFGADPSLPISACDPSNRALCYRIDGGPTVEQSNDGGQTWKVTWSIPPGRGEYMTRAAWGNGISCNNKRPDFHTFDLILLPYQGKNLPVVAMGNEGVLVGDTPGAWRRAEVRSATGDYNTSGGALPTPFAAASLDLALGVLFPELGWTLLASVVTLSALSLWAWNRAYLRAPRPRPGWLKIFWPFFLPLLMGVLAGCLVTFMMASALVYVGLALMAALPLALLIIFLILWYRTSRFVQNRGAHIGLGLVDTALSLFVFILPMLAFLAWAFGIIAYYNVSLVAAIVLGVLCLAAGVIVTVMAKPVPLAAQNLPGSAPAE